MMTIEPVIVGEADGISELGLVDGIFVGSELGALVT